MTLRLLTLVAGVATLALISTTLASGAPTDRSTTHFSVTTDASCTGEPIALDGTIRVFRYATETGNGSHFHAHVTGHFDGVGLGSGAKYIGTIEVSVNVNLPTWPSESATTSTLVSNLRIVRAGESPPLDDYNEHSVAHLTITANGEETGFVDLFLGGCA